MTACIFFGHHFEPRFEQRYPLRLSALTASRPASISIEPERVYIRDVCIRCGKTVERQAK